jgi:hypothetical protein
MALPGAVTTSDNSVGGSRVTRFGGPIVVGSIESRGMVPPVSGVLLAQSTVALSTSVTTHPYVNNLISTAAAAVTKANYIYIPQTTGPIATSSFAAGDSAPPYSAAGAVLVWDAGSDRLWIYSTASGSGVWKGTNVGVTTSAGGGTFTSS